MEWHHKYIYFLIVMCATGCGRQPDETQIINFYLEQPSECLSINIPANESTLRNLKTSGDICVSIDPRANNASVLSSFVAVTYVRAWIYISLTNGESLYCGFPMTDYNTRHPWCRNYHNIESIIEVFVDEHGTSIGERTMAFSEMKEYLKTHLGTDTNQLVVLKIPRDGAWVNTDKALRVLKECGIYWYALSIKREEGKGGRVPVSSQTGYES